MIGMNKSFGAVIIANFPGQNITTSGASASVTLANDSSGSKPKYVLVTATAAAYVRFTKGASTAVAADLVVQPGDSRLLVIGSNDTISALQVTAAGIVNIMAVENA